MNIQPLLRFALDTDADALAVSIAGVIAGIPYYNALAKRNETSRYSSAALVLKIQEDPYSVIVACDGDRIAGFCLSRFDDYTIWLEWFGVTDNYRGLGLTKKLLLQLEATVAKRDCHKIWCDCRTSNEAAIHLLGAAGYSQIATLNNHWYQQDFILWEKYILPGS